MSEVIRRLTHADLDAGFLESLDALRHTSGMEQGRVARIFESLESEPNHHIFVAERSGRIVGTATLLIEQKFIHDGGRVGHIEDVAVSAAAQRSGVGAALVRALVDEARGMNCYKVILDCADDLVTFYEGLGFSRHSVTMRMDLG